MEKVWSTFSTGPPRIYPRSPPSGTLSGLDSPVQTAQSAIIGVPVSYRTYRRDNSLLRLPVRQRRNLQGQSLIALQSSLAGIKYIIIDELSMVSQAQLAWVDRRLRQGTAVDEPFGEISV